MSDLAELTLVEAAAAIRKGETSSVALLEAYLARIARDGGQVNATIWIDHEGAMAAARAADAKHGPGRLHGVPLAHKDMYYQAGKRCTCGSAIRADFVPDVTATVIERLSEAGAFSFAGLNMAEFAQNPTGHNRAFGDCHNPWNLPYITGGSSSGSGAAVAARFVTAALGSDTGGSIRLPAAACGVTGLKPTQTRVSRAGVMPLSFSCDNVGPLARTARDCAVILGLIAGADPKDPTCATEPVPDYEVGLDGDLRGQRIGLPDTYFLDKSEAPVREAVERAAEVMRARGATIIRLSLPLMDAISAYVAIISRVEGATIHATWMRGRAGDYAAHLSGRLYPGYAIPGAYYVEALSRRGPILQEFCRQVFSQVDALLTPTIATCLPTLADTDIDRGPPDTFKRFMAVSALTRPFNYLGLPAISLPGGFDPNGLPIGVQLAGRPFAEARILKIADAYQRDTDWHRRQPTALQERAA
jgi:aspartyl-tRNA(Asn)/glutamyl-tRNA(Gln) amidotransferase subunit A